MLLQLILANSVNVFLAWSFAPSRTVQFLVQSIKDAKPSKWKVSAALSMFATQLQLNCQSLMK